MNRYTVWDLADEDTNSSPDASYAMPGISLTHYKEQKARKWWEGGSSAFELRRKRSSRSRNCGLRGMEGELGRSELARKLLESRRRFQKRMQLLIEKYNQPFEDGPVVQMATLTYQTPQGLRLWGGGVIEEPGRGHGQPVVPQSPLKNELRRKYLTRVDALLQEQRCSEHADDGDREDTRVTPMHSLARPAHGDCSDVSTEKPTSSVKSAAAPRACEPSASLAVVPRNDSLLSQGAGGQSLLCSSSYEAVEVGNATISDLYEGMLHSMSRLLRAKPSCVISTKTFIVQNWHCRRRPRGKSRLNRTYCKGAAHRERCAPYSKPAREAGPLSEPSIHAAGSPLKEALGDVNKPRTCELIPSLKELKVTPRKDSSSLVHLDPGATYNLDQENRFRTLTCLISPVKNVSRFRALQGLVGNRHREIKVKFDKLYREYHPVLPSQRCPPGSWALDVHRGDSTSPVCLQASETPRPSGAVPRRLLKPLEKLGETALEAAGCLSKHGSSSLLSKGDLTVKVIATVTSKNDLTGFIKSVYRDHPSRHRGLPVLGRVQIAEEN
ncbi:PREDICTED: Holliday junction recognition protein [Chrysochloris asiatica]|uniref:Holliday junction recognition protein n=1 Tax=Chrysochloris asiatica TaxID=185453 RepID=A0A9B0TTV7_CHRAS|nr:PREDICTED: Holliday junction recognition protein [Chrysochloris asiatica]